MKYLCMILVMSLLGCSNQEVISNANSDRLVRDVGFLALDKANTGKCPEKVSDADLKFWKAALKLGNSCIANKKWKQVEMIGQKFVESFPNSPWGFYYLSLVAENQSEYGRALWLLEKASEHDKANALLLYQKGRMFLKVGDYEGARKEFLGAINIEDNIPDAHLYLAQFSLRDQNFSLAEKKFNSVLKYRPFSRDALFGSAQCKVQSGDVKIALDYTDRILNENSKDVEVRLFKAHVLETYVQNLNGALVEYRLIYALSEDIRKDLIKTEELSHKIKALENSLKPKKQEVASNVAGSKK